MKKHLLFSLCIAIGFSLNAQTAKEWLALSPVPLSLPALSHQKDVDNKTFTEKELFEYSLLNVNDLVPDAAKTERNFHQLRWEKAKMEQDTVIAPTTDGKFTLNYYAVYLDIPQWMEGSFQFRLFGNAEIYLDGQKKLTYTENQPANRSLSCELLPGKHSLIIKTVTKGGKVLACRFDNQTKSEGGSLAFTLSPKRGKNIYDILNGNHISKAELSPSGKYAIVSIRESLDGKNKERTHIYRVKDKEIVYSLSADLLHPQWVPQQDKLSWLQAEGKGKSFYTYDIETQQLQCLIKEDLFINNYNWSPDLSYLLYYTTENYTEENWQLRKLNGIEDRQPYFRYRTYLCKYDFATGLHARLTWGNASTYLLDISHDGQQILFAASHPDYTEFPYSKQSVYLMNMQTQQVDTLWKDRLYAISCTFSPDDKQLLISGGPSAFGERGKNIGKNPIANEFDMQLYLYDLATAAVNPITKNFNPSVNDAFWRADGYIYITATDADYVHLFRYDLKTQAIQPVKCPGDIILSSSIPEKGEEMMYVASDVSYPARIYTLRLTDLQAQLWDNPSAQEYENIVFGEVKDWDFPYKKGTLIDGRYYLPADFDPAKKYPLIVYYYGGTTPVERSFGGRYPFNLFAANGYIVYVLQPSGAIGYGQEFSARHQNNWGKITADEIITATKAFIKSHSFVDATKVGCMGASYGGFTTMYLTTRTDLFTCAIAHAGISSITGYWGDGYWGYSYSTCATAHSFPWNRKDIYVDQSPLFNADKVNTPILLIHGTKDVNVPTAQSIQFYTALKLLGKEAELVFVKDSDHTVTDYHLRILWNNTILAYFAKYLKDQPAWWENIYKEKNL